MNKPSRPEGTSVSTDFGKPLEPSLRWRGFARGFLIALPLALGLWALAFWLV